MPEATNALTLLLTRPQAQSARFAAAFSRRFGAEIGVVIAPLIEIAYFEPGRSTDGHDGLIFTSENGVAAFAAAKRCSGPAFCVGDRTAAAAQAAGFDVRSAAGDAAALAALIRGAGQVGRLLHLRGEHAAGDLAQTLRAAGIAADDEVIYAQRPLPLAASAQALLAGASPVLLPLFSPRSATLFCAAAPSPRASLLIAALSAAVARAAPPSRRMVVATRPEAGAMLDALAVLAGSGTVA